MEEAETEAIEHNELGNDARKGKKEIYFEPRRKG